MNNFKKSLCAVCVAASIFTLSACGGVAKDTSQSKTDDSNSQYKTISYQPNYSSQSSSLKTTASSKSEISSSSVHIHSYNQKIMSTETLASEASYFKPATYYYTCDCGEIGSETFEGEMLHYDKTILNAYVDKFIEKGSYENPFWNTEKSGSATWNYIDGCMMTSFLKLFEITGDDKYDTFVKTYMDYLVKSDGSMRGYSLGDYNLDNINEGRVLFSIYDSTREAKYMTAIKKLYSQLEDQPRTSLQSFWHKGRYTNQVWLDGLYMAQPFYATYQKLYKDSDFTDIMKQFKNVEDNMKDEKTGLYYHGFDVTKKQSWSDKTTGLSKSFWLRAMGWYFAALSDLTEILPKDTEDFNTIQGYLKNAVDHVLPYLDDEKYMFYQVVDKGNTKDDNGKSNYLETSGSALIAYSILHAVNSGALDKSYWNIGEAIFNGICLEKLFVKDNEDSVLTGICKVAGLSADRNGTFEYYLSEAIVSDEAKGIAPFLMSYVEILKAEKSNQN